MVRPDETLDPLVGTWDVLQLAKGHRGSTDDRLTAWRAIEARPQARSYLDLGAGVGTVGLTALWHLPHAHLTAIEAQQVSHELFVRTVAHNGLQDRVTAVQGDIREPVIEGSFELVTGSPPYVPIGSGLISPHPQRAHCRNELRGGLEVYCEAAVRWMAPDGRFVFVMPAGDTRTELLPETFGLHIRERTDVVFRHEQGPFIAVVVCAHEPGPRTDHTLTVRGADGVWTERYTEVVFGLRDFPPDRRPKK